jgi:hypothetical protein
MQLRRQEVAAGSKVRVTYPQTCHFQNDAHVSGLPSC